MQKQFEKHPIFTQTQNIADICAPLRHLNIHNFCYTNMSHDHEMTWIATRPEFTTRYLEKKYYESDVHGAKTPLEKYMLGDQITYRGKTKKLMQDAHDFGLKQFFIVTKENNIGTHYYHFSTQSNQDMSQIYLSHIPELNQFIDYFHDQLSTSKELKLMSQFKVNAGSPHNNCKIDNHVSIDLTSFQNSLKNKSSIKNIFSTQQIKCLEYLSKGFSAKETAIALSISHRTVESYLDIMKQKLGFKNKYELIAWYCKK